MLKQRIILSLWWLLAIAVAGLLIAAVQQKKNRLCSNIKVEIEGNEGHIFLDETEIINKLKANGADKGKKTADINVKMLETILKKQPWIQNAELYFDNNQVLEVKIKEREPIARIFTLGGQSFYIDSGGMRLPLSQDYSAHVPVFTSFTSNKKKLSKPDSLLLNNIRKIALYIQQDSFWNAQVSQIVITPQSTFNIIPIVGNQTIILGNADSLESKFSRLFEFYKQVWTKAGFEKYETLNVSFTGQVIATKRDAPKPSIDSALAYRIINAMRTGADILKDSSLLFHDASAEQKIIIDTVVNQPVKAWVDRKKKGDSITITNKNSAFKKINKIARKQECQKIK